MVIVTLDGALCMMAILTWLTIIIARYCRKKCEKIHHNNETVNGAKAVVDKVYEHRFSFKKRRHFIVRALVPVLQKGPDDRPDKQQTILLQHIVPNFYIEQLLLFCFILLALTAHVFVSSYLFIKDFGCSEEPYRHCFEARQHFLVVGSTELDCTDPNSTEGITSIICYDLTLNFPRAIGEAGSTLASGAVYFGMITWILIKLSSLKCWKKRGSRVKSVAITAIQVGIMFVALVIVQARVVALVLDRDTVYEDIVLLVIYNCVVIIGGIIPWKKFKQLEILVEVGEANIDDEIELANTRSNGGDALNNNEREEINVV